MNANLNLNLKPLLKHIENLKADIKTKINDPQVRAKVMENIENARTGVEAKAKDLLAQTKDSRLMNEYVMPIIESEKTEQALKRLNERVTSRFGSDNLITKLEVARQSLIDAKVGAAKTATEAAPVEAAVVGEEVKAAPKARKTKTAKADDSTEA